MNWFIGILLLAIGMGLGLAAYVPTDDSDSGAEHRSGLSIYTDARTGCQYLGRFGVLTARMGADGKQICATKTKEAPHA